MSDSASEACRRAFSRSGLSPQPRLVRMSSVATRMEARAMPIEWLAWVMKTRGLAGGVGRWTSRGGAQRPGTVCTPPLAPRPPEGRSRTRSDLTVPEHELRLVLGEEPDETAH